MPPAQPLKFIEVIVSTIEDATEAEAGGADRIEVVRDLEQGGLTPDIELVHRIIEAVHIPARIMLRESNSMSLRSPAELKVIVQKASEFAQLRVQGLVVGFLLDGRLDLAALLEVAHAAPSTRITFHRAFDELADPMLAIRQFKTIPQVDRILTVGGSGSWCQRKLRLSEWQQAAAPEITLIVGAGIDMPVIEDIQRDSTITEVHFGRAARVPQQTSGTVSRHQVALLKGLAE